MVRAARRATTRCATRAAIRGFPGPRMRAAPCYVCGVSATVRDRLAIAIAAAAFVLGVGALALARFDVDVHLAEGAGGRVFVDSVDPRGNAWREGIRPGMVVLAFNGVRLISLPSYVY